MFIMAFGSFIGVIPRVQPRNVIGGHVISAIIGVLTYKLYGSTWLTITIGLTLAIIIMKTTHTFHSPGGATVITAIYTHQNFRFILSPVFIGAVCLVIVAIIVDNFTSNSTYPM